MITYYIRVNLNGKIYKVKRETKRFFRYNCLVFDYDVKTHHFVESTTGLWCTPQSVKGFEKGKQWIIENIDFIKSCVDNCIENMDTIYSLPEIHMYEG